MFIKKIFSSVHSVSKTVLRSLFYAAVVCCVSATAVNANKNTKEIVIVPWLGAQNNVILNHFSVYDFAEKVKQAGHRINTDDIVPVEKSDLLIVAFPGLQLPESVKGRSFLWLVETPISARIEKDETVEKQYDKIFTYKKDLVDNKKYFYMPVPYDYTQVLKPFPTLSDKRVLVAQIATNYTSASPFENYSERRRAADYFIKNAPQDFKLYGNLWPDFKKNLSEKHQKSFDFVYKGWVQDKIKAIQEVKFLLAYENAKFPGYVSEKIFDVMAGGAVPVYSGTPDIYDYVPKQCLINRDDFSSYQELYTFLKNMSDETYNAYLKCIRDFMLAPKHYNDAQAIYSIFEREIIQPYLL